MWRRLLSSLGAGAALALLWAGVGHGLGQAALGLVAEPQAGLAPPRWPAFPPDRPLRVLIVGTSLTQGGDWPRGLAEALSACRPGQVQVDRLARPGANSDWGAGALAARLAEGAQPDLMIAEFSINDASLWHGLTLERSRARHEELLATAAGRGIPVWLATMSPAFGREAWERPGQVAYRALYTDLARRHGAGLIATVPAWQALAPADRAASLPDGLHPTDAAMTAIMVPALAQALRPVLCPEG